MGQYFSQYFPLSGFTVGKTICGQNAQVYDVFVVLRAVCQLLSESSKNIYPFLLLISLRHNNRSDSLVFCLCCTVITQ